MSSVPSPLPGTELLRDTEGPVPQTGQRGSPEGPTGLRPGTKALWRTWECRVMSARPRTRVWAPPPESDPAGLGED